MTLVQLEYILSIAETGSFSEAARRNFVTQPTLSMQVKKLEEEIGSVLFDRNAQPIRLTPTGEEFVSRARRVIQEFKMLGQFAKEEKGEIKGELNLGIIPTLAPYLLPLFAGKFIAAFPLVELHVTEYTTEEIIARLKNNTLDCGILATPLHENAIQERPLFYEAFVAYLSAKHELLKKNTLTAADLDSEETWILQEGHCFRNQVMNFCRFKGNSKHARLFYESGSLLTLKKMVENEKGMTVLPEMAIKDFTTKEMNHVRYFKTPEPVREISLVMAKQVIKEKLIGALQETILKSVPERMKAHRGKTKVIGIES